MEKHVSDAVDEIVTDAVFGENGIESDSIKNIGDPIDDNEDIASRISSSSISVLALAETQNPVVLSRSIEPGGNFNSVDSGQKLTDVLNNLTEDVRERLQGQYERSLLEMNRSVI